MPPQLPLEQKLAHAWPVARWRDVTVLIAVSGGADSVALLRALLALRDEGPGRLVAAHFNHQLRGEESAADEAFVRQLSERFGLRCEAGRAAPGRLETESPDGLEAAARQARYEFFADAARRLGARYVATAHTADDQVETVLHRIVRGAGLAGLAGIARSRCLTPGVSLIRPLLEFRRSELVEYLRALDQPHREDSSNRLLQFTRNRVRHDLLPRLADQYNRHVDKALLRLARLAADAQSVIDQQTDQLMASAVQDSDAHSVRIDCSTLARVNPYLVRELMVALWKRQGWPRQAMTYDHWRRLGRLAAAAASSHTARDKRAFPGRVLAQCRDGCLLLRREGPPARPSPSDAPAA